jgi:hypothetical protein
VSSIDDEDGHVLTLRSAHSKNIGGIPVASDVFLFQKQQTFNRSKVLERMVHPCGSGAFGYFETTKNVSNLTVCGRFTPATLHANMVVESKLPQQCGREDTNLHSLFYCHRWSRIPRRGS